MQYAIKNLATGKYVAKASWTAVYTDRLPGIRWYPTEEAERDLCPENERIMTPAEIFGYER